MPSTHARRLRHVLLTLALVVSVTAAGIGTARTTPAHAAPLKVEALLVGDSVLNGLAQSYSAAGKAALAARHSFILESAGCRRLITTSCSIPPSPAPTNALTVVRADAGRYDRALVIAAGYDDPSSGTFGIGAAVDVFVAEAHAQGIDHVIWLTYRVAGPSASRFQTSNAVLRTKAAQYPELVLADWASRSAGMPTSWFSTDGIHLGPQSAAAMGALIGDALDSLPPDVPSRCAATSFAGAPPTTASASTGVTASGGVQLLPAPVRLVDTRTGSMLGAGSVLSVPVAGAGGVAADAVAALVSVVAVGPCGDAYLTAFPCGSGVPTTSVVNAGRATTVANSAVVRLGQGALCVYSPVATDVIVDVSGWIGPGGSPTAAVTPLRLIDTRAGRTQALSSPQVRLLAGHAMTIDLSGAPGFDPTLSSGTSSGTTAATVDVTAVVPAADGFVTVLPGSCSAPTIAPPATSTLNVTAGHDVAAVGTVAVPGGRLCVYASTDTDVIVDLQAFSGGSGLATTAADPQRVLDTRATQHLAAGTPITVDIGRTVSAAIVNLTAVAPAADGYIAAYPCGATVPPVSNVNVSTGVTVANRAVVSTDGTSTFCLVSSVTTDVVVDLEGWISAS
ncbi:MAG: hypothetical protein JWM34_37 [Ilumatobacteraceae bacterium]|nr:hypothetical protein [Ilumatobacteraceae bacterium]